MTFMRNILVFPDSSEKDFMYPANRDISVGDVLQAEMKDNSIHLLKVSDIQKSQKEIRYILEMT